MKSGKPIALFLVVFSIISLSFGLEVQTDYPSTMTLSKESDAKITIFTEGATIFDIVSILPHGWEITDWQATTQNVFAETRDMEYLEETHSVYRWRIECQDEKVEILLKIKPNSYGENGITTLWMHEQGFDSEDKTFFVESISKEPTLQNTLLLIVLLTATMIAIGGVAYREYKKIKSKSKYAKRAKK